ncbi:hypothetical protein C5Y96_07610 [Blastopirellula marina]|uniref:Peptidase C-terminal archaeal/bacterial domain-containing protein n=1 Tax=Blastopirellula marina TaxID=124 RepID=A0A2S8FXV9_9BACT|nr:MULTISPECIES: hypothetical protein [Pirellulaceae]PQO37017.1 hypothetical protein C5Y96_07610 [Blastopirellula marina]RCS53732.1 hypothetical protein DTL36_07620 [Bremerella cremea]
MVRSSVLIALALAFCVASNVLAAPQIDSVSLRGLTIGQTTRLTLRGKQLGPNPEVKLNFPTDAVRVLPESNPQQLELEIVLPQDAVPMHGQLRVATTTGISVPITLGIDQLPEAPFSEQIDTLPIALTGNLTGAQLLSTSFSGKAGQHVIAEVEAQRMGSKLQPLVSIIDERGTQLAYSSREVTLHGDARVEVKLPADGVYTIKLQDVLFKGGSPGHFRLKVGQFSYADLQLPLALSQQEIQSDGSPGMKMAKDFQSKSESGPFSGPQPKIYASEIPEVTVAASDKPSETTTGAAPIGISSVLSEPKETDAFLIDVTPGTKYRAEVFAQRLNSPVDAVLEIRKPDGGMLASSDDQNNTPDPAAVFDVPQGINQVKVSVHDVTRAGGPLHLYRIAVTPANHADFHLHIPSPAINIPAGGSAVMEVIAQRRGFGGPIALNLPNLPAGVTASLNEIPARADRALVTFTAAADAKQSAVVSVEGEVKAKEHTVRHAAAIGSDAAGFGVAASEENLGIGIIQKPQLTLAFASTPAANALGLGQSTPLTVKVQRGEGQTGPVRFSLVTSQVIPEDKGKPDMTKAIKLNGEPVLAADQSEMQLSLSVPQELKDIAWDVAVKGELLSDDKKQVKGSATTEAVRMTMGSPLFLALTGESIVRLKGKISRAGGFTEAVTIVAEGLPKEAKAAPVEVKADKTDFELEVVLPSGIQANQLANVKLVAKSKRNGEDTTSNSVAIKLETGTK